MPLSPGVQLGPYEILAAIGSGGMGEVYRARDSRLGRDVAIKVIGAELTKDGEWLRRFEQEARAMASVSHPNVLSIYDIGKSDSVSYIVTELLEGETLRQELMRGPLPIERAVEVTLQVLAGLSMTHERGMVHRDLKPENIFLTRMGHAKILDFGLAKVTKPFGALSANSNPTLVSEPGAIVGTISYMSPEQARGLTADARSDVFAIGSILYEMLCGHRAFHGKTPADTISSILKDEPVAVSQFGVSVPENVVRIIKRCLEKEPGERFQSARDVASALQTVSNSKSQAEITVPEPPEKSIAVLPFTNVGDDTEQAYLVDGLVEELIHALARLDGLRVASHTSSFRCRSREFDIRKTARQLNVETVLEGSVRRAGRLLRITVQLINVSDGFHLWSQRYDREFEDVFAIQDDITDSIVRTLKLAMPRGRQPAAHRHSKNLEAYEFYLRGRHLWHRPTESALKASIDHLEKAIRLDADYALAYAAIAETLAILRVHGFISETEAKGRAHLAAERAIAVDPGSAEAHFAMGLFVICFSRDWIKAEHSLREAVRISPQTALFHAYLGLLLAAVHRFEEAEAESSKSIDLDPLSPLIQHIAATCMYLARRYDASIGFSERAVELQSNYTFVLVPLGSSCCRLEQLERAIQVLERLVVVIDRSTIWVGLLGMANALAGKTAKARSIREQFRRPQSSTLQYVNPIALLCIDIGLRDWDAVQKDLELCVKDRVTGFMLELYLGPYLDSLMADSRFRVALRNLKVVEPRPIGPPRARIFPK